MGSNTKQTGDTTELHCLSAFYNLGYQCSIPFGENTRYDFIADINNILIRVQVKSARYTDETKSAIRINCASTRVNSKGNRRIEYFPNEVDYFATYFNDKCYLIPINECYRAKTLRLLPVRNSQKKKINYADDYLLEKQIDAIIKHL